MLNPLIPDFVSCFVSGKKRSSANPLFVQIVPAVDIASNNQSRKANSKC